LTPGLWGNTQFALTEFSQSSPQCAAVHNWHF